MMKRMKFGSSPLGSAMAVAVQLLCQPAMAQSAAAPAPAASSATPPAAADAPAVEQVLITATKREAAMTDVSLAVSALSQGALDARGVTSLEALGTNSTGMDIIKIMPGQNLLVSRGISSSQSFSIQNSPAVGVYVDEMPLVGLMSGVPDFGLWDVARVEMLRGPQGTLYGEGSLAGTIRIITNKPDTQAFSSRVQFTGSSVDGGGTGGGARAMINVPLAADSAALRATVGYNKDPGWITAPDLHRKDVNSGSQSEGRFALRLIPSTSLTLDANVWLQKADSDANTNQTSPGVYSPPSLGVGAIANDRLNSDSRHTVMSNLTANYDLGWSSLVSATSYSRQRSNSDYDTTDSAELFFGAAGANATLLNSRDGSVKVLSEELRLVSDGEGPVNWTVGGYLKKLDREVYNTWNIVVPSYEMVDQSLVISNTTSRAKAVFGEVDWDLTRQIKLTTGLRYYVDDRSATADVTNFSQVFQVPVGVTGPVGVKEKQTTYNVVLSWKPTSDVNYFARAASGFRAGGPNFWEQEPAEIPKDFKPEKIDSLELGVKTNPLRWLSVNAYAFQNSWNNKQVDLPTPDGQFDYISNASTARSRGGELELQAYPVSGLSLSAGVTYTDARLTADVLSADGTVVARSGSILPYVAKWEIKTSADYRWPLGAALTGLITATATHRSDNFSEISNSRNSNNGQFNLFNLKAGVERKKSWSAALFVNNLTNSHSITTIQQTAAGGVVRYPNYIQPRTVGLQVDVWY